MILRILLIFTVLLCVTPAFSKVVERIVAIVNNEVITQSDVLKYKDRLKNNQFVDEMLVTDPSALLEDPKKLIDHLINERLIDLEVKKTGFTVSEERIEQEIQRIAQANRITRNQLLEVLKRQGASFEDYHRFLRTKLERQVLIERFITPYIQISDDAIAHHYYSTSQQGESKAPAYEYKIAHILLRWDPAQGSQGMESARLRAEHFHGLLRAGEDFDALVAQHSKDSPMTSGGLLGTFKSEELLDELEVAIQGLEPDQFSGVAKGQGGFYILKLLAKNLIEDPDLTTQRPQIQRLLYQRAFQKRLQVWLAERRHQAFIRINGATT